MEFIKHIIKKRLWRIVFYNKIFGKGILLNKRFLSGLSRSSLTIAEPLNVFTKDDEDGIILHIFSRTGTTSRTFIDIGSNDCLNSNCANLAFHHNWNGVFIDGNKTVLDRGRHIYQQYFGRAVSRFAFKPAVVTVDNINSLLAQYSISEIDLLCLDLDGNDYFIWQAITAISPRVVLIEVQVEKGNVDFIPDYINEFELYEDNTPKGASPLSMQKLAASKGYSLAAVNKGCYNLFFVRNDCMQNLPMLNLEKALQNS